jgi:hypothetical protein
MSLALPSLKLYSLPAGYRTVSTRIEFVEPVSPSGVPKTMTTRSPGLARLLRFR